MPTLLIVYSTVEGQTRRIAQAVAGHARDAGFDPVLLDPEHPLADGVVHFDAALVAAPVHFGKHPASVLRFVQRHREALESVPCAFLSVSMSAARADDASRAAAAGYLTTFLAAAGWSPALAVSVAGALRYTRYGFLKRLMLRRIARKNGLPTDVRQDHELTDWAAVRRHTLHLLRRVEAPSEGVR